MIALASSCRAVADLDREMLDAEPLALTSTIYDAEGRFITTLHAEEDRELIPLRRIPEAVQDAVVAIEDQRFWSHRGVDLKAILRAAYVNATTGNIEEGGSTITQQYVKNRLLSPEQTLSRKIREASLAWQLEEELTKEEILSRYLNTVYFGEGAYGIQRGAETFFSKPAAKLTLHEGALLAGLIAGPVRWDPIDQPELALARRNHVLGQMLDIGMITSAQWHDASSRPLGLHPKLGTDRYPAPYFIDYVKHQLLSNPRFGDTYTQRYNFLFKGGLRIYTTIDLRMQRAAERAVNGVLSQPGDPYGALTAIDPRSGEIRAMVGGRDYWAPRREDRYAKVNLATGGSTGRQAGSSFKPFALVAALENGILPSKTYAAPSSIVLDEPPCGTEDYPWNVENYEGSSYGGALTVEQGLISSVNVVYAQIIRDVHPARVVEVAHRMGIRSQLRPYCSSVLGTNEVNTMEMASAFGTLATNGRRVRPTGILRIDNAQGEVLFEADPQPRQVLNASVAWTATQILRKVILYGTGTAANIGRPAAGKTGTAQQWRDAWFAGFIPQLSAAVWVGFPQGQIPMVYPTVRIARVTGGSFPAQIWHSFMAAVTEHIPPRDFREPRGDYVTVAMDNTRGCVATSSTPAENIRYIQFVPGTEPTQTCVYTSEDFASPTPPTVITGTPPGGVPPVVGISVGTAVSVLRSHGYEVDRTYERGSGYQRDTVIDQDPAPGTPAPPGSTVTIVVAR
ncbi:MAG: transglycosylase domain-containing protein [Actinomycetota bacterium]